MQVTRNELVNLLSEKPGAFPATFVIRTAVKLNKKSKDKTPCPFSEVWKIATVQCWLNCSYANAMEKETGMPYVPSETWHNAALDVNERLTPFSQHPETGALYLRAMRPKTLSSELEGGLTKEQIAPWMPAPGKEQVVGFRTYKLSGILSATFGGQTYEVLSCESALVNAERELVTA